MAIDYYTLVEQSSDLSTALKELDCKVRLKLNDGYGLLGQVVIGTVITPSHYGPTIEYYVTQTLIRGVVHRY